jgi:hypothetical protein
MIIMKKECEHIETFGLLTKEESLITVRHNIVPNTLVLESLKPFPGYHGENLPSDTNPEAVYFITSKRYSTDIILRTSKKIQKYIHYALDAIPGEIAVHNEKYHCIRIRNLESYETLPDLQRCFIDEGISFMKSSNIDASCLISLQKPFIIKKLVDKIFRDLENENTYYLEIPREISWSLFKKITSVIINNIDNSNFDAAKAYIYYKGITDFIRIYTRNPSLQRLEDILERYNTEIKKYI